MRAVAFSGKAAAEQSAWRLAASGHSQGLKEVRFETQGLIVVDFAFHTLPRPRRSTLRFANALAQSCRASLAARRKRRGPAAGLFLTLQRRRTMLFGLRWTGGVGCDARPRMNQYAVDFSAVAMVREWKRD
jgi:hypothetical protein